VRDSAALVALADARMYAAKQAGRNRCVTSGGEAAEILPAAA
jgi:PleD family two-component response regulator